MTTAQLAIIGAIALIGPVLALRPRFRIPVVIGELLAGVAVGASGLRLLDAADPTFTFLADDIGFALVMFVTGSHVPLRAAGLRSGLLAGAARAAAVGVLAVPAGLGLAGLFGVEHGPLYAWLLRWAENTGRRRRLHRVSEAHELALELRISLALLFAIVALAQGLGVSPMLAGFGVGLAVAAVGPPRRLARQLFGLTEGFFAPLFFVWLGASLDLRGVSSHPQVLLLGLALGASAALVHGLMALTRQPWPVAVTTSAQFGVPVAAARLGRTQGVLAPGEDAALLLGALVTIAITATLSGRVAAIARDAAPAEEPPASPDAPPGPGRTSGADR